MIVKDKKLRDRQSYSSWYMNVWVKTACVDLKGLFIITKVNRIYFLETTNVCIKFYGNPSKSHISVRTKTVDPHCHPYKTPWLHYNQHINSQCEQDKKKLPFSSGSWSTCLQKWIKLKLRLQDIQRWLSDFVPQSYSPLSMSLTPTDIVI